MKESKNAKTLTVTAENEITIHSGDEVTTMNPSGVFYYTQDFNVPVAVGVENGTLKVKAIEKSEVGAFVTGLKLDTTENQSEAGNDGENASEEPVYSVFICSQPLEVIIKDGSVKVGSDQFATGPLMIKDSSITGKLVAALDVVIVCRYMGITTVQHFQISLDEILASAK